MTVEFMLHGPDIATLAYVLNALKNPVMVELDDQGEMPDPVPQHWSLAWIDPDTGGWVTNRDVRMDIIGPIIKGHVDPETEEYVIDKEADGVHVNMVATGALAEYLMLNPISGDPLDQTDEEGNRLPVVERTCILSLLGTMNDVAVEENVAPGMQGSSGVKILDETEISTPYRTWQ